MPNQTSPDQPARSAWAVLTNGPVTWRQATEGWAVLTTLAVFGGVAAACFKAARTLAARR
jgi:hypothetical protein